MSMSNSDQSGTASVTCRFSLAGLHKDGPVRMQLFTKATVKSDAQSWSAHVLWLLQSNGYLTPISTGRNLLTFRYGITLVLSGNSENLPLKH